MALSEMDFLLIARRHGIGDDRARRWHAAYVKNIPEGLAFRQAVGYTGPVTPDHIAIKDYELFMLIEAASQGNEHAREAAIALIGEGNELLRPLRDKLIEGRPKKKGFFSKLFKS